MILINLNYLILINLIALNYKLYYNVLYWDVLKIIIKECSWFSYIKKIGYIKMKCKIQTLSCKIKFQKKMQINYNFYP